MIIIIVVMILIWFLLIIMMMTMIMMSINRWRNNGRTPGKWMSMVDAVGHGIKDYEQLTTSSFLTVWTLHHYHYYQWYKICKLIDEIGGNDDGTSNKVWSTKYTTSNLLWKDVSTAISHGGTSKVRAVWIPCSWRGMYTYECIWIVDIKCTSSAYFECGDKWMMWK